MYPRIFSTLACIWLFAGSAATAHEFWIGPEEYQVQSGAPLVAHLRNGQNFKGVSLAYFEKQTAKFNLVTRQGATPVQPRMGDVPALDVTAPGGGLVVVVHETRPSTLKYTDWDQFQSFAEHKDYPDIREWHTGRGLPETGFTESYRRFAKALVAVGSGDGSDDVTGMETEFVALTNPYTSDPADGFSARLYYQDKPRTNAQVEVFDKAPDGTVTTSFFRTDAAGDVTIPVTRGHRYLLDGVVLRPAPDGGTPVWESLWAALTFAVP